jgi:CHAD domain-containing protein
MTYALDPSLPLDVGLRAVAREQLAYASAILIDDEVDDALAIHNARKALKKVRAVLRLVIDEIGREQFDEHDDMLRDIARRLSLARDRTAVVSAFDQYCVPRIPPSDCERARRAIELRREDGAIGEKGDARLLRREVAAAIDVAETRVDEWAIDRCDFRAVNGGVGRSYRRVREAYAAVLDDVSEESLHDWRKRVKVVWYHCRLLQPRLPDGPRLMIAELGELGDLLGRERDLALVANALTVALASDDPARRSVLAVVETVRRELLSRATTLGARLFQHRAKDHVLQMKVSWQRSTLAAAHPADF